ncbi:MAG: ATP-binding cassette domain-containing protein [Pseudomonadota bacterium]
MSSTVSGPLDASGRPVTGRLRDRLQGLLAAQGHPTPPEVIRLLVDFTRALVRTDLVAAGLSEQGTQLLARRLGARTNLPEAAVAQLVRVALAPEYRLTHGKVEIAAFSARYGDAAGAALAEEQQQSLDLPGFARRHGSADALLLLDALVELHAQSGGVDPAALTGLQAAADSLGVDGVLFGSLLRKHDPRHAQGEQRFGLTGDQVTIGRRAGCKVRLLDPQVAPLHARLVRGTDGWRVVDAGSGRATVLDGEAVASAPFALGQRLRLGPYTLALAEEGDTLVAESDRAFSALTLRGVNRVITARGGSRKALLSDVAFTAYSGEVIAVIGPSGAGKTTLLNAITGIAPPDSGDILFDGAPFHRLLAYDRSAVGIVPQDDLVHPELTVQEALRYAGRLRFPSDVTDEELDAAVERVVRTLDIADIRHSRIGDVQKRGISGGQRKRVNLGQELLTRSTRVLFLDEPTSGLDPRSAQDIVRLSRRLADEGRIVFLVTHDLTPAVIRQVDHILVMHRGGYVAFFGPPDEACAFFKVPTPDALFSRLDDHPPAEWAQAYAQSAAHQKYVATREYLISSGGLARAEGAAEQGPLKPPRRSILRDLWTQTSRYARTKWRDALGAAVLVLQPPVLAIVMLIVFPEPTAPCIFMLALSALWFGMSAAVRELIADRAIWRRERRIGARLLPYLGSKVGVLGAIIAVQCAYLTAFLYFPLHLGAHGFSLPLLAAVMALTGLAGMGLGLLVSASFTSSEAAVGTLPLIIVPQITFSTIMVPLQRMGLIAKAATWVTLQRYALDAAIKCGVKLEVAFQYDKSRWDRQSISGTLYDLGLKPANPDDMGLPLWALMAALAGFGLLFVVLAAVITRLRDRQGA